MNEKDVPKGTLEQIVDKIEEHPEGIDFHLALPFERKPALLKGIRTVRYFTHEEAVAETHESLAPTREYTQERTPWQRVKDYFSRR